MTEQEILFGLQKAKEKNSNATIGYAVEQMFRIEPFSKAQMSSRESFYVYANYPIDEFDIQVLLKVICEIHSMATLGIIKLLGEDADYGVSLQEILLKQGPGHCTPLPPATISHEQIWHLLSNYYEIDNLNYKNNI